MPSSSAALLTIDLDAMAHNLAVLRGQAGRAQVAAVVKADGYGLGAAQVGRRLRREGVEAFFVAQLGEGEALRAALGAGDPATIYVLEGLTADSEARLTAARLTPVLATAAQAAHARALGAAAGRPLQVALNVDTGMNRQGLTVAQAGALAAEARGELEISLVMSHLGSAATPDHPRNGQQLARFNDVRALFPLARASLAASAGVFMGRDYRFDMVRPGISLYGGGPWERPDPRLRAVVTLQAPLLDIREAPAGEWVGYGESVRLQRATRVGIVGAGYADGLIRAAKGAGWAFAAGARLPLLIVNMDILAVDLGDAAVSTGDMVELLGSNVLLDDLAQASGTVPHECLVRLSSRAQRRYLGAV